MKKRLLPSVLFLFACALACICLAACNGTSGTGKESLTFRHYVAEDVAEIGGKYLINRNQAFDAAGNGYTPVISVERNGEDITSLVNNYVLDVDVPENFTVKYAFTIDKKVIVYNTAVTVADTIAPQIILEEELPAELEYMGELELPEILVADNSGKPIVPTVGVYGNETSKNNLLEAVEGKYVMSSDVKNAIVMISAADESGNEAVFQKEIRVRRKGEKDGSEVSGLIRYLSRTDSTILNDAGVEYVYSDDSVNGGAVSEIVTVEIPGALADTFPTLVFKFPEEYNANCVISLDLYAENMSEWMSVFPQYNGSGAAPEYGLRDEGFAEGKWVHISNVFKPAESNGYSPDGTFDSIRLTFPGKGTNGETAIVDATKGMVIKVANLTVSELPEREDLSDLGLEGNISDYGSFFVNYPFATAQKGVLSDGNTDALKITIPAETEIKHSTLIFDLDQAYPTGSIVSFKWEAQNMDLDALVSGYGEGGMVTEEIHITSGTCSIALPAKSGTAGGTFDKVALYLRFDMGQGGYTGAEITLLIGDLRVDDLSSLGALGKIGNLGNLSSLYPTATFSKGMIGQSEALELTIPKGTKLPGTGAPGELTFDLQLSEEYAVGSVIEFEWETENTDLNTVVTGYNGGAVTTGASVTQEKCRIVTALSNTAKTDTFRNILFYFQLNRGGNNVNVENGVLLNDIVIRIANLKITPPTAN